MKIKADWTSWLHRYKHREIAIVFSQCRPHCFDNGLELGSGDGYQSVLLSSYVRRLVCTEINERRLCKEKKQSIDYKICSAEDAVLDSPEKHFDIVFSSNLLEHVSRPTAVLSGIHRILKDDGVTIHIVPGRFWKLCQILLYVPVNAFVLAERVTQSPGFLSALRELKAILKEGLVGLTTGTNAFLEQAAREEELIGNNPEKPKKKNQFLMRLFFPQPHGISETHRQEFMVFGKNQWKRIFEESGFKCIAVRKGPAASGYGLGWVWAERLVEKMGIASEYIFITQKKGSQSTFPNFFKDEVFG